MNQNLLFPLNNNILYLLMDPKTNSIAVMRPKIFRCIQCLARMQTSKCAITTTKDWYIFHMVYFQIRNIWILVPKLTFQEQNGLLSWVVVLKYSWYDYWITISRRCTKSDDRITMSRCHTKAGWKLKFLIFQDHSCCICTRDSTKLPFLKAPTMPLLDFWMDLFPLILLANFL